MPERPDTVRSMEQEEQWIITRLAEYAERHFPEIVSPQVRERADMIPVESITLLRAKDYLLHAQVVGTQPYLVTFKANPVHVQVSCTCPVRDPWCKHAVAVVTRLPELTPGRDPLLDFALGRMTAAELVALIDAFRSQCPQAEPLLTELAMPEWFDRDHPGDIQRAIAAVNIARHSHDVADWERAVATLRHIDKECEEPDRLLAVVEQAVGFLALEDGAMLGDDRFRSLILQLLEMHRNLVREIEVPATRLADFLAKQYFSPTLPDPYLEDFEDLLGDDGLQQLLSAAAARGTTRQFASQYADVAVDVALVRGDWREAARLSAALPDHDKLFWYFDRNGFTLKCEELLRRAVDPSDALQLSVPLVRLKIAEYLDVAAVRGFLRRELMFQPSVRTFIDYLEAPAQTYDEVMTALAELNVDDPDLALMAATQFKLYDEGYFIVENHSVSSMFAAAWAVDVELPRDPVTAVRRLFAYFRLWLTGTPEVPLPRTRDNAAHVALRISQLRTALQEVKDPLLSEEGIAQWEAQLEVLKQEFAEWPFLLESLAGLPWTP